MNIVTSLAPRNTDHARRLEQAAYIEHVVRAFDMGAFQWRFRAHQALKEAAHTIRNMQAEIDYLKRDL